jgi:hypothetical protein
MARCEAVGGEKTSRDEEERRRETLDMDGEREQLETAPLPAATCSFLRFSHFRLQEVVA